MPALDEHTNIATLVRMLLWGARLTKFVEKKSSKYHHMIYQTTPNTMKVNIVAQYWLILSLRRVIDSQSEAKIEFLAKNTKNHDFEGEYLNESN